jgi:hypothetical protein
MRTRPRRASIVAMNPPSIRGRERPVERTIRLWIARQERSRGKEGQPVRIEARDAPWRR